MFGICAQGQPANQHPEYPLHPILHLSWSLPYPISNACHSGRGGVYVAPIFLLRPNQADSGEVGPGRCSTGLEVVKIVDCGEVANECRGQL